MEFYKIDDREIKALAAESKRQLFLKLKSDKKSAPGCLGG